MNATLLFDKTGHEVRRKEFLVYRMYAHAQCTGLAWPFCARALYARTNSASRSFISLLTNGI